MNVEGAAGLGGQTGPSWAGGLGGSVDGQTANGGFGGGGGWQGGGGGDGAIAAIGGGGGSYVAAFGTILSETAGVNGIANGAGGAGNNGFVSIGGLVFTYTGALQTYMVATSGFYEIIADGAQGGSGSTSGDVGGYGADIEASFFLSAGTVLDIIVGGAGNTGDFNIDDFTGLWAGGGGGGSFIYEASAIPEPSALAVMSFGVAAMAFAGGRACRTPAKIA